MACHDGSVCLHADRFWEPVSRKLHYEAMVSQTASQLIVFQLCNLCRHWDLAAVRPLCVLGSDQWSESTQLRVTSA
eukprot:2905795-Rhodomonas_salina.1